MSGNSHIHMPPSLVQLLQEHQTQQRAERSALGLPWAPNGLVFATEDMREGTKAFLEKRPAKFTGR